MTVKLKTPSNGSVSLTPQDTASDVVLTVPAATGTVITTASTFAGTGPAFSAGCNSGTNCNNTVFTKIFFQVEDFDTNSNYNSSTSVFTPTVAGYYMITARQQWTSSVGASETFLAIYKNGAEYKRGVGGAWNTQITAMVYMNGSTDYLEVYAYQSSGVTAAVSGTSPNYSTFAGFLARAA